MSAPCRVAGWSGPRTISTAMMRAWENRPDTVVSDEPFYASYLAVTGLDHPGREDILEQHESNWKTVLDTITGPIPGGADIWYQKHMAHHLRPEMMGDWLDAMSHVFLIRHPREMLPSLAQQIPKPGIEETGLPQQLALFNRLRRTLGHIPIVIDSQDVLEDPRGMLEMVCRELDLTFCDAMLTWPSGSRDSDGTWAPHWYHAVEESTGFIPWTPRKNTVPRELEDLCRRCCDIYEILSAYCIRP